MERVRFITHNGRQILSIDFSSCSPEEMLRHMQEAQQMIAAQPQGSVLTLTDVTNAHYNREVSAALKAYTSANKPYVRAAAIVGVTGMREVILNAIILFTRRNFSLFSHPEDAKEWLAQR
ncbi:MAG TPA: hypothetical protein VFD58_02890 [Blastocatellia bacterium]|nr:hypothetical protein [Blastocatellia bacterium]